MSRLFSPAAFAKAMGFAVGWAGFAVLLSVATRPMRLGPGFSNLFPYAAAAILLSGAGHLVRRWLKQTSFPKPSPKEGFLRRFGGAWLDGLLLFFKGTAAFNNFIFLSIAYLLGVGLTSMFVRKQGGKKPAAEAARSDGHPDGNPDSYWRDLESAKREADAYYRPF